VKNVGYIITTTICPYHKIDEVLKIQLTLTEKDLVDDSLGTYICPGALVTTKDGIKNTIIFEVKPGKLEEALTKHRKIFTKFRNVEGYSYMFEVAASMAESLPLTGIKPPQ
jgi:hypothetical protein